MTEVGNQVVLVVLVLAITLGPALTAGWFLQRRKRIARQQRRSPLVGDLLRAPGQTLREQIEELRLDVAFDLAAMMFVPTLPLALFFLQVALFARPVSVVVLVITFVAVAGFVAFQIRSLLRRSEKLDRLRLGLDAEAAVGEELQQLVRRGATVFHDFPAENFNIDHVVIAPQGVFAVESKGYSKPNRGQGKEDATVGFDGQALKFPTWTGTKPVEQAGRQADWLAKWLGSAIGSPVVVVPVLALPGWFVDRTGRGRVRVFSGRELGGLLSARGGQPLSDEEIKRIVHQVEQRCRTVSPVYAAEPDQA